MIYAVSAISGGNSKGVIGSGGTTARILATTQPLKAGLTSGVVMVSTMTTRPAHSSGEWPWFPPSPWCPGNTQNANPIARITEASISTVRRRELFGNLIASGSNLVDSVFVRAVLSVPIRTDPEFPLGLHSVVGLQRNHKEVRAAHPLVHRELCPHVSLLPGLQGRRTDDHVGGSAALDGFNAWAR